MNPEFIREVEALLARIKRGKAVNVNDRESKQLVIDTATKYFSTVRPAITEAIGTTDAVLGHDNDWQELVKAAHGNNPRNGYVGKLRKLKKQLENFNVARLTKLSERGTTKSHLSDLTPQEKQILGTLDSLVPSAGASYRQGMLDLQESDRLSYRGTACEFRESLRETLDHLAPDDDVEVQSGYKHEAGRDSPTMKQKVRYVLKSRNRNRTQRKGAEKSLDLLEGLTGEIMRATYDRGSLSVHVETTRGEVLRIKRYVDTLFFDLLEIAEPR